ncbi:MAG: zinc-dependent peptidase [Planctomycetaceae bacterium]|nr:zinc-dependent peptidase [Planctomycetaceae bacterium]
MSRHVDQAGLYVQGLTNKLMFFAWWKRRRRARLLAEPFPASWRDILQRNVVHYTRLGDEQQHELERRVQVFVAEKNWEGCKGLDVTDEMRVTIAAQACLLVLAFPEEYYDHVLSVLIYPTAFVAPDVEITRAGIVIEGSEARTGEAWYRGPVIVSWEDALAGGRQEEPGHSLVLHEFAHQLDMRGGRELDGTPPLPSRELAVLWADVMEREFQQLCRDCRSGRRPLIDCYGTKNRAEFFAVATETFFERPAAMAARQPELFSTLRDYYRQDPRL